MSERTMRAFTDTVATKVQLIATLEAHKAADAIVQNFGYWKGNGTGKGCAVGCSLHDFAPGEEDQHARYEDVFGIPQAIAHLEDRIFEGLPAEDAKDWPLRFVRAVPEGADLSRVVPAVLVRVLERRNVALADLQIADALRAQVADAIEQTLVVVREWRDTGTVNEAARSAEAAARSAAWSAEAAARSARSAAEAAAWSAAWSAEAAEAAAWSAEAAARSARSAAEAAEAAAWSAAWSAEYHWLADTLIEEIEKCAPVPRLPESPKVAGPEIPKRPPRLGQSDTAGVREQQPERKLMDHDEIEPLERHPEISREATCQECDEDLHKIGTLFACQNPACSRYAVPVNEYGNTDAEQENEDERNGMRQHQSDMENGYDVPGVFGGVWRNQ